MNLGKRDVGRQFIAPSGRRIEFEGVHGNRFMFVYVDDREEGLALSGEGLRILEQAPATRASGGGQ
jgi:hypothetical protein